VYACAREVDAGVKDVARDSAMAKLFASMSRLRLRQALQIHGGYGYMKDYPIESICATLK